MGCKDCPKERQALPQPLEQKEISRRGFVGMLMAASAAFAAASAPLVASAAREGAGEATRVTAGDQVALAKLADLPEGKTVRFAYPGPDDKAVLIHLPGGELRAWSEECTHLGCAVYWDPGKVQLVCPCHKGFFNPVTGAPISGPPKRALPGIQLEIADGVIYAVGRYQP